MLLSVVSVRDEYAGSMWWKYSGIWAYFLFQNSSLIFVPDLSFFLAFTVVLALKPQFSFLSTATSCISTCLAHPSYLDVWKRITNTRWAYAYSDLPDDTHSLHLSTCLKRSSLVVLFDRFPPKIRKAADIPKFRHIVVSPTCYWQTEFPLGRLASLAWFVGAGGNNYGVKRESMRLRKAKRDELGLANELSSGGKFPVTDIKSFP